MIDDSTINKGHHFNRTARAMRVSSIYSPKKFQFGSKMALEIDEKKSRKSLHESMKALLITAQILGQFPVMGVTSSSIKDLRFVWKSWKVAYCLLEALGTIFIVLMLTIKMMRHGTDLFIMSTFVFHVCKLSFTLGFLHLARAWPKLMRDWDSAETHMRSYGSPGNLEFRIKLIAGTILSLATFQYIMNQVTNLLIASDCKETNMTTLEYFYVRLSFPYVFSVLYYSGWTAALLQILDLLGSMTWCYVDVFIMVMSTALALRFKQVTKKLSSIAEQKNLNEGNWKSIREDYNRLCRLCKHLDNAISYIVLMSFGTNLYFILILLFNSLRQIKNTLDKIYFFFSFGFLILRTVYVALYAAWINDESKKPVAILNSVPSSVYNLEIRRFVQQISFDAVALTGRNFFSVTRGLILSVAGAIVTYELVLIQFNENLLKTNATAVDETCSQKV